MNININIEKRHVYFLAVLICVLFIIGVSAYTDVTGVGHNASSVGPGTFAPGDFVFPGVLSVQGDIIAGGAISLGNKLRTSWPDVSRLPAENISSGTFGANLEDTGTFIFPANVNVKGDLKIPQGGVCIAAGSCNTNGAGTLKILGVTTTEGGLVIETRTNDPASPASGRMWLRTDIS